MTSETPFSAGSEAELFDAWRYVDAEMSDAERDAFEIRLQASPRLMELVVEVSRIALAAPLAAESDADEREPRLKPAANTTLQPRPARRQRASVVALTLATCVCLLIVISAEMNTSSQTDFDSGISATDSAAEAVSEFGQLVSLYSGELFHPVDSSGFWEAEADVEPVELEVPDWLFAALELDSVAADPAGPNETDDELDELGIF